MRNVRTLLRSAALAVVLGAALPAGASAATGAIQGTVTAVNGGAAIPQYAVDLYSANRTKLDTVCTTNAGSYAFSGLATGSYYVSFSGDASCASTGFAPQWFDARLAGKNAEPVNVTDGAVRPGVDASLELEGTVSGTVKAPGGLVGRGGVSVRVIDTDNVEASRTCTAPDGTYTVRRLTPVPYVVQFVDDGSCGVPGTAPSRYYKAGTPAGAPSPGGASPVSTSYGLDKGGVDLELSAPERTLTVNTAGSGVVSGAGGAVNCAATCTTQRPQGSSTTLTATPAAGSSFTGWTGACTGTSTCQVTLDADKTVGATFTVTPGGGDPGPGTPGPGTPGGTVPGGGTPGGVVTPPVVVPPVVSGPGTTPTTPTTPKPTPRAACKVAAPSKVKRGRFTVQLRCDRKAKLVLSGSLKFKRGKRTTTVKLTSVTTTATTKTVTFKVPAKAARALRSKVRVSATLRLKATTSAGSSTVAGAAKRLR